MRSGWSAAVDLPVTIDFEGAYAVAPDGVAANMARLAATGAIGCNFEDQVVGGEGLHPIDVQAERIAAARAAVGADFFINARTDIFLKAKMETHDEAMVDAALERARAYAEAGASGFFVPLLADLELLERFCAASPLPVNFMAFPGCPPAAEVAAAGVARISHGPFPHKLAMKALGEAAAAAMDLGPPTLLASAPMGPLLQRFDDPETERAFLRAERAERGQAIRALIVIAVATLLSYIVLNPMHFPPAGVVAYTQAAGALIAADGRLLPADPHPILSGEALDRPAGLRRSGGGDEVAGARARRPRRLYRLPAARHGDGADGDIDGVRQRRLRRHLPAVPDLVVRGARPCSPPGC